MNPTRVSKLLFVSLLVVAGCERGLNIHDRPIPFSADRVSATLQYITDHYGENPEDISIVPRIIFLVDRDGTVYRLMPETWMARHCIGLNSSAIGVENVGGGKSIDNMTDEQIAANIQLVRYLAEKYPTIRYLIGHMEYRDFEGHPLWLELDEGYRTEKVDPGDRFMTAVRDAVADLGLEGPP